jgi:hypothetical protein
MLALQQAASFTLLRNLHLRFLFILFGNHSLVMNGFESRCTAFGFGMIEICIVKQCAHFHAHIYGARSATPCHKATKVC